jgi:hypothetical protein
LAGAARAKYTLKGLGRDVRSGNSVERLFSSQTKREKYFFFLKTSIFKGLSQLYIFFNMAAIISGFKYGGKIFVSVLLEFTLA